MKNVNILAMLLVLLPMCVQVSQAEEMKHQNKQKHIAQQYGKKVLGMCLGICAVQTLNSSMFQYKSCNDYCYPMEVNRSIWLDTVVRNTVNIPMYLVSHLRDKFFWRSVYQDKKGLLWIEIGRAVIPLGCAFLFGYASYKLLTSCDCSNEKEAEELTV